MTFVPPARARLEMGGRTSDEIRQLLATIKIDGMGGIESYASEDCERFIRTVQLIPGGVRRVLEIGANPYFTTILARWFRPELEFTCTNFFGATWTAPSQEVEIEGLEGPERHEFSFQNVNVETQALPGDDGSFDCVLFCEVLEHMTNDPLHSMREINRVLRPGGHLVLTTPNVARLENVARLLGGVNLYDPYSGHGPYGRHNREYSKHELWLLLQHCGFEPEVLDTQDVHENISGHFHPDMEQVLPLLAFRALDLGQYHFTLSKKTDRPQLGRPDWLFRSYSEQEMKHG